LIPQDKIKRLIESMPRRVQAVIDADGGPTNIKKIPNSMA
jgi:hypothetical protein